MLIIWRHLGESIESRGSARRSATLILIRGNVGGASLVVVGRAGCRDMLGAIGAWIRGVKAGVSLQNGVITGWAAVRCRPEMAIRLAAIHIEFRRICRENVVCFFGQEFSGEQGV